MTKTEAHAILDKIRDGMPVAGATQALQRTGDIPDFPDKPLRSNGNEPKDDRASPMENTGTKEGFSYSRYLDCQQNQGT